MTIGMTTGMHTGLQIANQASKQCLRIWPRPLACLGRRICSLQMEEVNTF